MSLLAIEINDAAVTVADASGVVHSSPGYALLGEGQPRLGQAAGRQALLLPSRTNSRFWEALDTRQLNVTEGVSWTHADLVYRHLKSIWQQVGDGVQGVILAVPGDYSQAQLGTLLGILEALEIPVRAMVDSALVAMEPEDENATLLHLEAQLHRTLVTRLDRDGEWQRSGVEVLKGLGLLELRQRCVSRIAKHFVRQTRFDPLHSGASEQALFDQLPGVFAELGGQDAVPLVLEAGQQTFSILVTRDELTDSLSQAFARILHVLGTLWEGIERPALQVASQLAVLPGFLSVAAAELGTEPRILPLGAAALGALKRRHRLIQDGGPIRFTARLADPFRPSAVSDPEVTHVLYRGQAFPIGPEGLLLGTALGANVAALKLEPVEGVADRHCKLFFADGILHLELTGQADTLVNDAPAAQGQTLVTGDRLRLGGMEEELLMIRLAGR